MKPPSFLRRGGSRDLCPRREEFSGILSEGGFYGVLSKGGNFRDLRRFAKGVRGWSSRGLCPGGILGVFAKGGILGSFPKGCQRVGNSRDLCQREAFSDFLKRDGILWVFGKGVKSVGFWQRGKILGASGEGGGGQFSVLFLKRRYSGYFCKMGKFSIVLQKEGNPRYFCKGERFSILL